MNSFILLVPFLFVRFAYMSHLRSDTVGRAAHFAPVKGKEQIAYIIYQITQAAIIIILCISSIHTNSWLFYAGMFLYLLGLAVCAVSIHDFAYPNSSGLNTGGIYRFSRNPMYVAYFIFFLGCAILIESRILIGSILLFQLSAHWIILAEERWCFDNFKDEYMDYCKRTRRYL